MTNAYFRVPEPINEPILNYLPGRMEKEQLKNNLELLQSKEIEVPLIIGGKEIKTGDLGEMGVPHNHNKLLGTYHKAGKEHVQMAVDAALEARKTWAAMPDRSARRPLVLLTPS